MLISDPVSQLSPRTLLTRHVLATSLIWLGFSLIPIMPILARREFAAREWQTTLITAAFPTFLALSIFWNEALKRIGTTRYLWVYWLLMAGPLAAIGLAQDLAQFLVLYWIAAVGQAGWPGLEGHLLRRFYGDERRGRVFGVTNVAKILVAMGGAWAFGLLLEHDRQAFRYVLPICAAIQALGILLLTGLIRRMDRADAARPALRTGAPAAEGGGTTADAAAAAPVVTGDLPPRRVSWREWLEPVLGMHRLLRADPIFLRYEQAFMTYGMGWMAGHALLPIFADKYLQMSYPEYANSTQVALNCSMLVCIYPLGWLNDRIGPVRTSALAFALLALYPIGLLLSRGVLDVALITAWYGIGMAGVQMGWMLGPVALAGSPERAAHYVAIHATLVGFRAVVGQLLAMLLYQLTGSLLVPFSLAAAMFVLAAWQMRRLHDLISARSAADAAAAAVPAMPAAGGARDGRSGAGAPVNHEAVTIGARAVTPIMTADEPG